VGQKLLPKDCLPAAPAAQRNTRSAENPSLKHLPAAPGRPNLSKNKKSAPSLNICRFFLCARCALKPLDFQKSRLPRSVFWPSDFFWRRFGLQNLAFCLCFLSAQKRFSRKMLFSVICAPPAPTWPKNATKSKIKISREFPPSYSLNLGPDFLNPFFLRSLAALFFGGSAAAAGGRGKQDYTLNTLETCYIIPARKKRHHRRHTPDPTEAPCSTSAGCKAMTCSEEISQKKEQEPISTPKQQQQHKTRQRDKTRN